MLTIIAAVLIALFLWNFGPFLIFFTVLVLSALFGKKK